MAWKPAEEMASSFLGRVWSGEQPMETVAYAVGIVSRASMVNLSLSFFWTVCLTEKGKTKRSAVPVYLPWRLDAVVMVM